MNTTDSLQHFLFDNTPIRGNVVKLDATIQQALAHQQLPSVIGNALCELMTASALLIATLKMEGAMILQLQSKGALKLLVVECNSNLEMRATAKWQADSLKNGAQEKPFLSLIEQGQFVITLDPTNHEPYQGIVPIEGDSIAVMLENYMLRSQQIDTRLWLYAKGHQSAGMLIQKLPQQTEQDADQWHRINQLANTLSNEELLSLDAEEILTRLFHEEEVRVFQPRPVQAFCSCSADNVANMLVMVGKAEVESVIAEQGSIDVHCDFCNKHYVFDEQEALALFDNTASDDAAPVIKH